MKKALKVIAIVIGALILILLLAPFLFKDQIVKKVKQEANKQLNATVDFDNDISLSFFRNFPNASLGIDRLCVIGQGEYKGDTLAYVKKLHIVIDLASLFGEEYQIRDVRLDQPFIQLLVDSSGNPNWDIMRVDSSQTDTASTAFKIGLQKYAIQDGRLIYSDSSLGFLLELNGLDHTGKGDFTQDVFDLNTTSHARQLTLVYGGIPYLNHIEADIDANINIDLPKSKYSFTKNTIKLNGLTLGVDGYVALPDSNLAMDLSFKATKADFKNFLSLIPAIYQKNFDKLKASGALAFNGFVKGIYNEDRVPAFGLQLTIDNGMFQYPSVPEPLSDVNLDLAVKNDDGIIDHTFINVKKLHFALGNNPFDARLTLQNPTSDPKIDGAVKGKLNLSDISKIYPFEKGTTLSGMLDMDVQAKGSLSSIEHKRYDEFNARGRILANNVTYKSSDFSQGIEVHQGQLTFSPQQVKVSGFNANMGKSDLQAEGGLSNFFGYLFGKDQLRGNLKVTSTLLDMNEIMGADNPPATVSSDSITTTDTSSGVKAVIIPRNIHFNLQTTVGHFIYDHYDLTHVQGNITLADGILTINNLSTNMLDGTAKLKGSYNTRNPEAPKTDLSFNVQDINIQKAFKTFVTVKALAPIAAFVQGDFSGDLSLNTLLNDKLYPKLTSLNSIGNIRIPNLNVKGFTPLMQLSSQLGLKQLQNVDLHKLLLHFKVDSGFLKVKPFDLNIDGIKMNIAGKNGLNKVIDYTINMDIPRAKLGDANNAITNLISKANNATGGNLDLGASVPVAVHLGGTVTRPEIKLDLSAEKSKIENALKSEAKQQLNKGAHKLLNQVLKGDSTSADTTQKETSVKENVKNALQKGLKGLLNRDKKKDSAGK